MTRICIIGKGSFVGGAVAHHLEAAYPDEIVVSEVDTLGDEWQEVDFSRFDSLFYVSGIVPWALDRKGLGLQSDEDVQRYLDSVNADLAASIARKAKADGAGHLIFMSTSDVYAKSPSADPSYTIDRETSPSPESAYGSSKLKAEQTLAEMEDDSFTVAILRPPIIYGPNCQKGSFASLARLAAKTPVFPKVQNARSMLYTGNLAELVAILAKEQSGGIYLPQDAEWACTAELVRLLGDAQGHHVRLSSLLGIPCSLMARWNSLFRKVFGNFKYAQNNDALASGYQRFGLAEAISASVVPQSRV